MYLGISIRIVAFILFAYQIDQSFRKYFQGPIVLTSNDERLNDATPLAIVVCKKDPINWNALKCHGYTHFIQFLVGRLKTASDELVSWNGKRNLSYESLVQEFFQSDYYVKVIHIKEKHFWDKTKKVIDITWRLFYPHGFCALADDFNFNEYKGFVGIVSDANVSVHVIDKSKLTNFGFPSESSKGDKIEINYDNDDQSSVKKYYKVKVDKFLYSNNIPGEVCSEYDNYSYSECLEDNIMNKIEPALGCNPPWISKTNHCYGVLSEVKDKVEFWVKFYPIGAPVSLGDMDQNWGCPKPCPKITTTVEHYFSRNSKNGNISVFLTFDENVKVDKHIIGFDVLNLVVDIGGSLGLWLGWSAVGIVEEFLSMLSKVFKLNFNM